jgi:hypothetical protein
VDLTSRQPVDAQPPQVSRNQAQEKRHGARFRPQAREVSQPPEMVQATTVLAAAPEQRVDAPEAWPQPGLAREKSLSSR